jgi:hypothetical protein
MCPFDVLLKKLKKKFFSIFKLCFFSDRHRIFSYTVHQALKRGRGQPWKVDVNTAEVHQKANSPGPGKGSVPYGGVGYCLGPERNGVSSGVGGEGGSGPSGEERNKHSNPSKEEGNMEQEEGGPACTE